MTMSKGQTLFLVPDVPRCSEMKNSGTASLHANGAGLSPKGRMRLDLILLFCGREFISSCFFCELGMMLNIYLQMFVDFRGKVFVEIDRHFVLSPVPVKLG
jgi:hypothetical protein